MNDSNQSDGYQSENQSYVQPNYQYPSFPPVYAYIQPPALPGQGAAITGFILNLIGLWCVPLFIPGIICSIVALAKGNRGGIAIAGLLIGILCFIIYIFCIVIIILNAQFSLEWFPLAPYYSS